MTDASPDRLTSLSARVIGLLIERAETVATAESLTGGLIGGALTAVPGASAAYLGGVISYATRLKESLAGVPPAVLRAEGPVAAATARAMAAGVREICGADWGLAVTGVAGPEPQDGHPVGQVFVALVGSVPDGVVVHEFALSGTRGQIRDATVLGALELMQATLEGPARQQLG